MIAYLLGFNHFTLESCGFFASLLVLGRARLVASEVFAGFTAHYQESGSTHCLSMTLLICGISERTFFYKSISCLSLVSFDKEFMRSVSFHEMVCAGCGYSL